MKAGVTGRARHDLGRHAAQEEGLIAKHTSQWGIQNQCEEHSTNINHSDTTQHVGGESRKDAPAFVNDLGGIQVAESKAQVRAQHSAVIVPLLNGRLGEINRNGKPGL